jgi:hypothetical protein
MHAIVSPKKALASVSNPKNSTHKINVAAFRPEF